MLQEKLYESGTQGQIKSMMSQFGPKTEKNSYIVKHWQQIKIVVTEICFESRDFLHRITWIAFC